MATQTIIFAARRTPTAVHVRNLSGGAETAGSSITEIDDGLFSATFVNLSGDFTLHLLDGATVMGVGAVWDVTNTTTTFYEQDLVQPSAVGGGGDCPTASEVAAEVVAELAAANLDPQNVISPYPIGGTVRTTQGTAYKNSLANRIEWPDINGTWPVLTGATITIKIGQDGTPLTFTGAVITATGSSKRVGVELEEADTTSINVNSYQVETGWRYLVTATISGDVMKLAEGKWISSSQPA